MSKVQVPACTEMKYCGVDSAEITAKTLSPRLRGIVLNQYKMK